MTKILCLMIAVSLVLSGCIGSEPNPVLRYQVGDEKRSCQSLNAEIASNEAEIIRLVSAKQGTTGYNVAMGVAGIFLIVPWFFMNVKGKETAEINAFRHRNRTLRQFAGGLENCRVPKPKFKFDEKKPEKEDEIPEGGPHTALQVKGRS